MFDYIDRIRKLKIVQTNKNLQSKLNVGIHSYLFNPIYKELDDGSLTQLYYNINDNSIFNILEKKIKNKEKQKKILTDFFNDLYNNYYKDLFIINYDAEFYYQDNFNILLSLKSLIKIYVRIELIYFNEEIEFNEPELKKEGQKKY